MPGGIKTKSSKTGSYADGTKNQLQGKSKSKSQQDLDSMSNDYADKGAALRTIIPAGNQSYADFQKNRKSPEGQKAKADYEASNKLSKLTDADYQGRIYNQGMNSLRKTVAAKPDSSVFTDAARSAAYSTRNKTSMEMGNQVSGSSGKVVDNASLADRSKRMGVGSAYSAPGMSIKTKPTMSTPDPIMKEEPKSYATYQDGSKSIKTKKSGMSNFINGEADKVKNMSDKELDKSVSKNINYTSAKQNKMTEGLLKETVNRKWKKQGGYATGTKSIKTKKMC